MELPIMEKTAAAMIAADAKTLSEKAAAAANPESGEITKDVAASLRRSFLTLKASCSCLTKKRS